MVADDGRIRIDTLTNGATVLTVLGGSSPATIVLISELNKAITDGRVGSLVVRLVGRDQRRLEGIKQYCSTLARRARSGLDPEGSTISLETYGSIAESLRGAQFVLCQVRPGGMRFRGIAEDIALSEGIPGDEGIGPGGMACYLRSRHVLDDIAAEIENHAADAITLMMTSPLGLAVRRVGERTSAPCFGVCELPMATARKIADYAESALGIAGLNARVLGLNHQSWLTQFRDPTGQDHTAKIIDSLPWLEILGIDTSVVMEHGAIPVNYLRLFYHTDREIKRQMQQRESRGRQLSRWFNRMHDALANERPISCGRIESIISERDMTWYRDGVIPVLAALVSKEDSEISLNIAATGKYDLEDSDCVIEASCTVSRRSAIPVGSITLPDKPARLFHSLRNYESLCHQIPEHFSASDLLPALSAHPLVSTAGVAQRLAHKIRTAVYRDMDEEEDAVAVVN